TKKKRQEGGVYNPPPWGPEKKKNKVKGRKKIPLMGGGGLDFGLRNQCHEAERDLGLNCLIVTVQFRAMVNHK
ncbi:MAG: hypothetical protein FWD65_07360, partial [Coriobacteriia bacterium]|nr:hypothetical protein [Coriobacteriia bacterium]